MSCPIAVTSRAKREIRNGGRQRDGIIVFSVSLELGMSPRLILAGSWIAKKSWRVAMGDVQTSLFANLARGNHERSHIGCFFLRHCSNNPNPPIYVQ